MRTTSARLQTLCQIELERKTLSYARLEHLLTQSLFCIQDVIVYTRFTWGASNLCFFNPIDWRITFANIRIFPSSCIASVDRRLTGGSSWKDSFPQFRREISYPKNWRTCFRCWPEEKTHTKYSYKSLDVKLEIIKKIYFGNQNTKLLNGTVLQPRMIPFFISAAHTIHHQSGPIN